MYSAQKGQQGGQKPITHFHPPLAPYRMCWAWAMLGCRLEALSWGKHQGKQADSPSLTSPHQHALPHGMWLAMRAACPQTNRSLSPGHHH